MDSVALLPLYINNPRKALRRLSDAKPLGFAFLLFLLANLSRTLGWLLVGSSGGSGAWFELTVAVFFTSLLAMMFVFLQSGIIHWVATWSGAGGNAQACMTLLMTNWTPYTLMVPFGLFFSLAGSAGLGLMIFLEVALFFVILSLNIMAMQENYRMTFQQSLMAVFAPLVFIAALGSLYFIYMFTALVALFL